MRTAPMARAVQIYRTTRASRAKISMLRRQSLPCKKCFPREVCLRPRRAGPLGLRYRGAKSLNLVFMISICQDNECHGHYLVMAMVAMMCPYAKLWAGGEPQWRKRYSKLLLRVV